MKKLIRILCVVLTVSLSISIIGCTKKKEAVDSSVRMTISGEMHDGINSKEMQNYSFYVMKVKGEYRSIIEDCVDVYRLEDHISPDMEDGQIALVVADVSTVTGGFAGYCDDIFVESVESITILDYKDVINQVDIPVAGSEEFAYYRRFFQYENNGDVYFVFLYHQYIEVYVNGKHYMEYEFEDLDDDFKPFFDSLE